MASHNDDLKKPPEWFINFGNRNDWVNDTQVATRNIWEKKLEDSGQVVRVVDYKAMIARECVFGSMIAKNAEAFIQMMRVLEIAKTCIKQYAEMTSGSIGTPDETPTPIMFGTPDLARETLKIL